MSAQGISERGPTSPGWGSGLVARLGSGFLLAAIALAAAWLGGWVAAVVMAVLVVIVHVEWIGLTEPSPWPAALYTGGLVIALAFAGGGLLPTGWVLAATAVGVAVVSSGQVWRPIGVAYAATFGFALLTLRYAPGLGFAAVVVLFATVWATDTGAFLGGRAIGGPRLRPSVSPNKTWAGAVTGLVAGVGAGAVASAVLGVPLSVALMAVLAVLCLAAQGGDLFESWVKRQVGAKDSGHLIPGHGGLMDRVDGLVFAAALALAIGWIHGGASGVAVGLLQW